MMNIILKTRVEWKILGQPIEGLISNLFRCSCLYKNMMIIMQ